MRGKKCLEELGFDRTRRNELSQGKGFCLLSRRTLYDIFKVLPRPPLLSPFLYPLRINSSNRTFLFFPLRSIFRVDPVHLTHKKFDPLWTWISSRLTSPSSSGPVPSPVPCASSPVRTGGYGTGRRDPTKVNRSLFRV